MNVPILKLAGKLLGFTIVGIGFFICMLIVYVVLIEDREKSSKSDWDELK